MIFSNRYAREAAGFSAVKVSRIEKGQLWVNLLQFLYTIGGSNNENVNRSNTTIGGIIGTGQC